jgi:hypothetical protein
LRAIDFVSDHELGLRRAAQDFDILTDAIKKASPTDIIANKKQLQLVPDLIFMAPSFAVTSALADAAKETDILLDAQNALSQVLKDIKSLTDADTHVSYNGIRANVEELRKKVHSIYQSPTCVNILSTLELPRRVDHFTPVERDDGLSQIHEYIAIFDRMCSAVQRASPDDKQANDKALKEIAAYTNSYGDHWMFILLNLLIRDAKDRNTTVYMQVVTKNMYESYDLLTAAVHVALEGQTLVEANPHRPQK